MNRTSLKEWTEILTPWAQVLALIAAGIFAIHEYLDHKKEVRVQRAVDYISRYTSDDLMVARLGLVRREQEMAERFKSVLLDKSRSRDEKNRDYLNFVVRELVGHANKDGAEEHFYQILGFLDDGVTCVRQGLCDESTVKSGLLYSGRRFVRTYTPYLCYLRQTWHDPTIGQNVEEFYNHSAAATACEAYYQSIKRASLVASKKP